MLSGSLLIIHRSNFRMCGKGSHNGMNTVLIGSELLIALRYVLSIALGYRVCAINGTQV